MVAPLRITEERVEEVTDELLLSEAGEPYTGIGLGWILERIDPIFRL
jgi:hypothetical protein